MKKISIIVPVYNNAKYLPQCLDSILNQTHQNFEVLLVCDVGQDNSHEISLSYAQKSCKIRAFIREKELKRGVSSARNLALENIAENSDYVAFIDADDWVEPTYLETLQKNMEKYNADMSYCSYKLSKPTQEHIRLAKPKTKLSTTNQAIKQIIGYERLTFVLWNKLYKAQIAKHIRFDESIHFIEDTLWVFEYLTKCNKVVSTNQKLYHYIQHPQSALRTGKILDRMSEIETYEQVSQMAENFSQTSKCFMRSWQYIMMVEKLWLFKKSKLKTPEIKEKLLSAIECNKPYFVATRKHLVFYRKLTSLLEKLIGK